MIALIDAPEGLRSISITLAILLFAGSDRAGSDLEAPGDLRRRESAEVDFSSDARIARSDFGALDVFDVMTVLVVFRQHQRRHEDKPRVRRDICHNALSESEVQSFLS